MAEQASAVACRVGGFRASRGALSLAPGQRGRRPSGLLSKSPEPLPHQSCCVRGPNRRNGMTDATRSSLRTSRGLTCCGVGILIDIHATTRFAKSLHVAVWIWKCPWLISLALPPCAAVRPWLSVSTPLTMFLSPLSISASALRNDPPPPPVVAAPVPPGAAPPPPPPVKSGNGRPACLRASSTAYEVSNP